MIERIKLKSVNSVGVTKLGDNEQAKNNRSKNYQPQFTGIGDLALGAIQACERIPMVNVTVLDLTTAIIPRTYEEGKTNGFAGFEAFRRESSGLIVNCLIPSVIVLGVAKAAQKTIMGEGSKMANSWANEDTIKTISEYWKKAEGKGQKAKVKDMYTKMFNDMSGIEGERTVSFKDKLDPKFTDEASVATRKNLEKALNKLVNATTNPTKYSDKQIKKAFAIITQETHVSEHITTGLEKAKYSGNLRSLTEETPKILKEFIKHNIADEAGIKEFVGKSTKLVKTKSLIGLGIIIPLALAMQPINRMITAKMSGKKGAPIYKDFQDSVQKELTPAEKSKLFGQKLIGAAAMVGVALLSVMKKPDAKMFKEMTQFRGLFPTMDQARLISTATFASRIMASEDKNDLREATVRDIATFSAFYFLGDYVAKGIATMMPKKYNLINKLEGYDKSAKGLNKFWQWAKNTSLKSSDEIFAGTKLTQSAKNMRAYCQVGNIAFSLVALGLLIPKINRKKTGEAREAELKKAGVAPETIKKYYHNYPNFMMNSTKDNSKSNVYKEFFTSK